MILAMGAGTPTWVAKDCLTSRYLTDFGGPSVPHHGQPEPYAVMQVTHPTEAHMAAPTTSHKLGAEALGTFWLVLGGCGTAVLAGGDVHSLGIALAFGLTVLTGAYAFGHISGGHFNPAVTIGLAAAKRLRWNEVAGYVVAQLVGAVVAASILYVIASGQDGFDAHASGFAANGYGD